MPFTKEAVASHVENIGRNMRVVRSPHFCCIVENFFQNYPVSMAAGPFLRWEAVALTDRNPYFSPGHGTGWEPYFLQDGTEPEEVFEKIVQEIGLPMLRAILQAYPFSSQRERIWQALRGEQQHTSALLFLESQFTAHLARQRAKLLYSQPAKLFQVGTDNLINPRSQLTIKQTGGGALEEEIIIPISSYAGRKVDPTGLRDNLPEEKKLAWDLSKIIGAIGHPVVREFLHNQRKGGWRNPPAGKERVERKYHFYPPRQLRET